MDATAHTTSTGVFGEAAATLPLLAVVAGMWLLEQRRRGGNSSLLPSLAKGASNLLPEFLGLAACACISAAMLHAHRGASPWQGDASATVTDLDHQVWQEITSEWRLLTTADSLLALQAMVRTVLVFSAALRSGLSPLAGEPAAFLVLAASCRVLLLAVSPKDVYHLEGPLGGNLNVAFEVLSAPALAWLARSIFGAGARRMLLVVSAALLAGGAAWCHRFGLAAAGEVHLDVLFSLQLLMEFLGAGAFCLRAIFVADGGGVATSFVFAVLPLQQLLQTVFILTAFASPFQVVPELVGAGRPFEVMQACSVVQVGLYVIAALWHFVLQDDAEASKFVDEGEIALVTV